ncbi:hypothetical protein Tco_0909665 [Tanacetum coccineum]|uniref:Uncharacterized protein n=1 Tax=Tanacetum coccineum TaxID=301880 RepID=A0ABQ5CQT2_9ASTR
MKENILVSNLVPNEIPPAKKVDSILKPKKTTRTMNPESGDTMKHRSMLGKSSQVNFKDRVARSGSKMGGLAVDMEEVAYERCLMAVILGNCVEDSLEFMVNKQPVKLNVQRGFFISMAV